MLALRKLVEQTVDYQATHADFIHVIMTENIHQGKHKEIVETITRYVRTPCALPATSDGGPLS